MLKPVCVVFVFYVNLIFVELTRLITVWSTTPSDLLTPATKTPSSRDIKIKIVKFPTEDLSQLNKNCVTVESWRRRNHPTLVMTKLKEGKLWIISVIRSGQ